MSDTDASWACTIEELLRNRAPVRAADDGLTDVVGEMSFDTPIAVADLAALERSCTWCFETYRVQLIRLLVSRNRQRAVLLFRAPDAESVRLACRHAEIAFDRIWPCSAP